MLLMLSNRLKLIEPSPTLAITAKVRALKAAGVNVISFGAGEPDFDTPEQIKEAGIKAIRDGHTKYTAGAGTPELRQAICEKLKRDNGIHADIANVVVSNGAKQAIFNSLMTILNPGDEVILFAPFWMTYRDQILLAEGVPVIIHTTIESNYSPTLDQIRSAITPKTKAMIINSPCNPTGAVYSRQTIKEIAAVAIQKNIFVISDEIYEKHLYDGAEHLSIASLGEEIAQRTITVGGVSKTYSMTGWRIGYSVAPEQISQAISSIQDQITSNASSISQKAAEEAMKLPPLEIEKMVNEFAARRKIMLDGISKMSGVNCIPPAGAFYVFADVSKILGERFKTDSELANYLLEECKVALVPGSVFYGPGHLRMTYSMSRADIQEGLDRIHAGLQSA